MALYLVNCSKSLIRYKFMIFNKKKEKYFYTINKL